MARPRRCLGEERAIFSSLLIFKQVGKASTYWWAPSWLASSSFPQPSAFLQFVACMQQWHIKRWAFYLYQDVLLAVMSKNSVIVQKRYELLVFLIPFFAVTHAGGHIRRATKGRGIFGDMSGKIQPGRSVCSNPAGSMLRWDCLTLSGMCTQLDVLWDLGDGLPSACGCCTSRCKVHSPVVYQKLVWRVSHSYYHDHGQFSYYFCVSCWIFVALGSK